MVTREQGDETREARRPRGSVDQREAGLKGEPETGGLAGDEVGARGPRARG
jgi:hypothetical protein